jgi:hypothetical protein
MGLCTSLLLLNQLKSFHVNVCGNILPVEVTEISYFKISSSQQHHRRIYANYEAEVRTRHSFLKVAYIHLHINPNIKVYIVLSFTGQIYLGQY